MTTTISAPTSSDTGGPDLLATSDAGGPLGSPGAAARGIPFVLLLAILYVTSPLGVSRYNLALVSITAVACIGIILVARYFRWSRVDTRWQVVIPFAIILVNPFLRHATGGAGSGVSLLLLPMLWLALYHSRLALMLGIVSVFGSYLLPQVIFDHELYPDVGLELRRALTISLLYGTAAFIVHRLITQVARTKRTLEIALERERQMVQQLTELDRLKNRFVAIASHELRTPLTSISGFSKTVLNQWDSLSDDDKRTFIGHVDQQGDRLKDLVDDLLVLSRIQSDTVETRAGVHHLQTLIDEAVAAVGMDDIAIDCPRDLRICADGGHMQSILTNFLTNACKYGQPPFQIRASVADDSWVELRVVDSGDGVSDDFLPRLFHEFERDERHENAGIQGTGLGLSIVRGLVRAQGGQAWYEDDASGGAVFAVRLPRAPE